jgi:subtilisin family serine protease
LVIPFSIIYELTAPPSSSPLTEVSLTTSPLTGLRAEILDAPTQAAPGEELSLHVRVYKPNGIALPSAQLYAYLYCYQLGLRGCLNAGPGDWRDWIINRIDIAQIDPAYISMEAHENIFELKLRVKENALAYLDIAGVADISLRARLRVPCSFELDENGENVNVTVREKKFSVPVMDRRVYTSETKYSLRGQGVNPSLDLSSKGHLDIDFTVRDFLIGEAIAPEPLPAVLPRLTDLRVELLDAPTGVRPGEEFSLRVRVRKPEGMVLPNAQLYAYLYCPRLGLEGCLNSAPEGFINWTANAINITVQDPDFRRVRAHDNTFELRIRVKENALEYLELQGANYVRLRARLRMPVAYSPIRRDISIEMGAQRFTSPVLVEKRYEGETQYYLSDELVVGNDIHVGSKGNLDYDATVTVVLSEGGQLTRVERALQYVSRVYGISQARLIPENEQHGELRTLGLEFWRVNVLDPVTQESYDVAFDEAGNIVSERELRERENQARWRKYGKLSEDLHDYLENVNAEEKVKVGIWLADVDARIPRPGLGEVVTQEVENKILAARENFEGAIGLRGKPVVDYLRARGFEVTYASRYAPLVFVEMTRPAIMELQGRSDIVGVYRSTSYARQLYSAAETVRAPEVWYRGITGSDVKVAIVEDDAIAFDTSLGIPHPYLEYGSCFDNGIWMVGDHATAVAGIVASIHPTYKGIAYGAPALLSADAHDAYDYQIIEAMEWALDEGADIFNLSWGGNTDLQMDDLARYTDHVVWNHLRTVVVSAGNINDNNPLGNVDSPGIAYNVITVGAINDQGTSNWSDDNMASFSCYRNPSNAFGAREKPEVVAVGCHANEGGMYSTTMRDPFYGPVGVGTSYSAPAVAGEAALIMDRNGTLAAYPEVVKAVIMASAVHNIEGNSRLSDKDGAGAIDCWEADEIVWAGHFATNTVYRESLGNWSWNYTINASAGRKVRVVLCWMSHGGNAPESDFDLRIYDSRGSYITGSTSRGGTFQIAEFTAPYSGNYTARVTVNRFDGDYEYLALAYRS